MIWLLLLLLTIPIQILNGYALSRLWAWFIVPVFGLPSLTIVQAIGIWLVITYCTGKESKIPDNKEEEEKEAARTIVVGIVKPLIALLFGFVVKLFL